MLLIIATVTIFIISVILNYLVVKYKVFIRFNLTAVILNAFLFIAGLFMIFNSTEAFDRFSEMKTWPVVTGVITDSKVVGERAKRPELDYRYTVNGKAYLGNSDLATPSFGGKNYRDQSSRAVISKFNKGDSVKVFYNPDNLEESVLKISPKWSSFMQYGLGIIFLSLAFGLLFSGLLERK